MATTKIADVIVPEVFNPYVVERTAELTALYLGGIISNDPQLDALATAGGKLINMPFWKDLTGESDLLSDSAALVPEKITSSRDLAALHMRGKAWGVNDLATALSGDDPSGVIGDLVAEFWARDMQRVIISSLGGVFADNLANNAGDMIQDEGVGNITVDAIIDVLGTMGDAEGGITAIAMPSNVYRALKKLKALDDVQRTGDTLALPSIDGRAIIVDDGCPFAGGIATCYAFGAGAIGLGFGGAPVPTETDRDSLAGEDLLINRNHFVLHPRGVKFNSTTVAGETPSNAELALAVNWTRVYERKNVRLAELLVTV